MSTATVAPPTVAPTTPTPLHEYRVLQGEHIQTDEDGVERKYGPRCEVGAVFKSRHDFQKRDRNKYDRVHRDDALPADPAVTIQPGESVSDFAARIAKLAGSVGGPVALAQSSQLPQPKPARDLDKEYGALDKKSTAELTEIAEAEEIDFAGATRKEDILKAIRGTVVSRAAAKGAGG